MLKTYIQELPVYKFEIFQSIANIEHFVTTREHGNTDSPIGGFNLSYKVNDVIQNVTDNRNFLANSLQVSLQHLFIPVQTHSVNIQIVTSKTSVNSLENTDALITAEKNIAIATMAADCVPILVYDYKNQIAAAIHAGWKGTLGRILEKTIATMVNKLGAETKNMKVGIGPSICEKVYEVGNEVANEFNLFEDSEKQKIVLPHTNPEKKYLNLQVANQLQALKVGVKPENIQIANLCTYSNPDQFYSARYFKNNCGRFATGIVIR